MSKHPIVFISGDTGPPFRFRVRRKGAVVSLSGATVEFRVELSDGTTVTKAVTITDAANGECEVPSWLSTDLDVPGEAWGELVITFASGVVQHGRLPYPIYVRAQYSEPVL